MAKGARTTAFLVDDDILIDAGTGLGELSIDELCSIDHILLTHSHLDHVLGVPLLADVAFKRRISMGRPAIQVHALSETLAALRQHIFNEVIWPDFTVLPSANRPILQLIPLNTGQTISLGSRSRQITVLPASHTVPAVGFAVQGTALAPAWVYSGDTAECPEFWVALENLPVQVLVMENAFAQADQLLAEVSRHHSPDSLTRALRAWQGRAGTQIAITHIKPGEESVVLQELRQRLGPAAQLVSLQDCLQMTISEHV
jgi:ribonuclease BN (tRNA processing enzyme)